MTTRLLAAALLRASVSAGIIHPGGTNPGFELGTFADWTTSLTGGTATITGSTLTLDGAGFDGFTDWLPTEGTHFALLRGGNAGLYQTLSTLFTATAGDRLLCYVFLDINEEKIYLPSYNDDGYVKLINTATLAETILFAASVASLPNRGNSGWTAIDFTLPATGTYRLEFGVRNLDDKGFSPQMGIDLLTPPDPFAPFRATLTSVIPGEMHIHFPAQSGLGYTIQYKNSLSDPAWLHLADIAPPPSPRTIDYLDPTIGGQPQRFYRIVTPQMP